VWDQFEAEWKKLGMSPAKQVTYNPNQPSYAGELQKALEGRPDLLIILGYAADTTIIVKEFYTTGLKTRVMGMDFAMNTQFVSNVGNPAANGLIKIGPILPVTAPGFKAFEERFNTETKLKLSDYPNAAQTHDQINLVALAIEAGKSTKGADLAKYLREVAGPTGQEVYDFAEGAKLLREGKKINYQGASGPCDFDDNHNVAADFGVWVIDAQGVPQLAKSYKATDIMQP
jgi:branched-chain amino acid transport system substrate-binding protein